MAKFGGKQPGAGRPKGSTNVPRFSDYVTEEDRQRYYDFVNESYMGDNALAKFYGEHAFAKPPVAITGEDGAAIVVAISGMKIVKDES